MAFILSRSRDNVAGLVTPTVAVGTVNATYPASYLNDMRPARPAKLTTTSGAWQWDFGSAQRVDDVYILGHNLDSGLGLKVQGSADAFSTTPLDASVFVPARWADQHSVNLMKALTALTGYTTGGYRYWRVRVTGTNSVPVAVGEVWLSALHRSFEHVRWGMGIADVHPVIEHRTGHHVRIVYDKGVRYRKIATDMVLSTTVKNDLLAIHRDALASVKPVVIVLDDTGVYAPSEPILAYMMGEDLDCKMVAPDFWECSMEFEELSPGLPL